MVFLPHLHLANENITKNIRKSHRKRFVVLFIRCLAHDILANRHFLYLSRLRVQRFFFSRLVEVSCQYILACICQKHRPRVVSSGSSNSVYSNRNSANTQQRERRAHNVDNLCVYDKWVRCNGVTLITDSR